MTTTTEKQILPAKLICFAGTGGTGKTSIVNRIKELNPEIVVYRSIVRDYYLMQGVKTESDFLKLLPEERVVFQLGLYEYYCVQLEDFLAQNRGKVVVSERSLYDHYAYTIFGSRELLTKENLASLNSRLNWFHSLRGDVFFLPYPTPWDDQAADGFRARDLAKDLIIDALIFRALGRYTFGFNSVMHGSVDERVKTVTMNSSVSLKRA